MHMQEDKIQELIRQAVSAKQRAYAPYSNYRVGAAVYGETGRVYSGCNIENASFGATICAERTAIFKAVSEGERKLLGLALVADDKESISPCGICRQVMAEFGLTMPVYMAMSDGSYEVMTVEELLPRSFVLREGGTLL
jgi:cytidine deaminase